MDAERMEFRLVINKTYVDKLHVCHESGNCSCIMAITPSTTRSLLYMFIGSMVSTLTTVSALSGFGIMFVGLKNTVCEGRCFIFHIPHSNVIGSVVSFYIPVFIMLCIYLKILFVAQKQARSIHSTKAGTTTSGMERKATKTLAIIMGVFLLCWTPFFVSITLNPVLNYSIPAPVTETLVWLGWSNSMLNPFVYCFFYSWFRSAFRIIISGKIIYSNYANAQLS